MTGAKNRAFTLIELVVVIAVLGVVLLVVAPRLPFLEEYALKSEARRVAGLIKHLSEASTTKKVYYRVWFYPEKEELSVESSASGLEFKPVEDSSLKGFSFKRRASNIDLEDIVVQGLGKVEMGSAAVIFNPGVGAEAFSVHLRQGEKSYTITYNPFSGRVKVIEGYV